MTTGFYTHNHLINRQEAEDLGLPVVKPADKVEKLMLDYYAQLIADFELRTKFDPAAILAAAGAQGQAQTVQLERAYIETKSTLDDYVTEGQVSMQQQQAPQIQVPGVPQQQQLPALPAVATFEITADEWRQVE